MVDGTEKKLSKKDLEVLRNLVQRAHWDRITQMQENLTAVGGMVGLELARINRAEADELAALFAKL